jgi:hypothetical protein
MGAIVRGDGLTGWPRALWLTGTFLFGVMVFHVVALAVTGGPVNGPVSLRKPATFAETGWLIAWSVALVLPTLRTRAWQRYVVGATTALFAVGETAIIGIEAWRGVPSHYNFATPFDAALMRAGAGGTAMLFLVGLVVMLVAALRTPDGSASLRLGVRAGIVVLLVGCAIGFVMISNNSGVFQGTVGSDFANRASAYLGPSPETVGPQYLLLRPATQGGDLILPHAIGIHALALLAAPAVLLARTGMSRRRQLRIVGAAVASVGVAMAVLLAQALRQLPLEQLSPVALVVLGLCAVVLAACELTVAATLIGRETPAVVPAAP